VSAATSAIVTEEDQRGVCIYCGAKITKEWEFVIFEGLEYKITECDSGCKLRIKTGDRFSLDQFVGLHRLDWGKSRRH